VSFQGIKWTELGVGQPPQYKAEVKERVQLKICSPSVPSWLEVGCFFSFLPYQVKFKWNLSKQYNISLVSTSQETQKTLNKFG
jgi:hypothetical protein